MQLIIRQVTIRWLTISGKPQEAMASTASGGNIVLYCLNFSMDFWAFSGRLLQSAG